MSNREKIALASSRRATKARAQGKIRDLNGLYTTDKPMVSGRRNREGRFEVELIPRGGNTGTRL